MRLSISNSLTSILSKREYLWGFIVFCLFFASLISSQSGMDFFSGVMFLTTIYWTIRHRSKPWHWPHIGLSLFFLIWFVVISIGITTNPVKGNRWDQLLEFRWMIEFYVFLLFISLYSEDRRTIKLFSIMMTVASGMAITFYFLGYNPLTENIVVQKVNLANPRYRAGGLFDHAMPLAHSYGPLLLMFVGLVLANIKDLKKISIWTYLGITLMAITVLLTYTRGIWIGAACGLVLMGFILNRRLGLYIASGVLIVGGITFSVSPKISSRIKETVNMTNQGDLERITIWKANWEMIKDHPLVGIGYSQNKARLREYYDKLDVAPGYFEGHAHNEYIHLFSGTGLLGFICYLSFLFYTFRAAVLAYYNAPNSNTKGLALGIIGSLTCFYVGSLTEANFSIGKNRYMILFLMAWAVYLWLKNEKMKIHEKK